MAVHENWGRSTTPVHVIVTQRVWVEILMSMTNVHRVSDALVGDGTREMMFDH